MNITSYYVFRNFFVTSILLFSGILAGCNTTSAVDGRARNVFAMEYNHSPTRDEVAQKLGAASKYCWVGKRPEFAGYAMSGPSKIEDGWMITFSKSEERDYILRILRLKERSGGYFVQADRIVSATALDRTIKSSIRAISRGGSGCFRS